MSKVNLVQSKSGPTIVKLVNTQAAGIKSGTTTSTTSQTGQILSLNAGTTSIVGSQQGTGKTLVAGQNIVIAKQQVG